ncbi:MAG: FtsX-like permease family protein, partial [Vicinamibacterales bacterium]
SPRGQGEGVQVFGKLREGVSLDDADAERDRIAAALAAEYPETNRGVVPRVATHAEFNSGPDAPMIWGSLFVAAWFVLLIACANLANLSLVRTIGRWREFATRVALGAGQARMIRHIVIESLILAGTAGALGWWLANWTVNLWVETTASKYQALDYTIDAGTFAYLVTITLVAVVALSVAPVVRVVQLGVGGALKGDARGVTQGLRGRRLSAALVAGQMALAIVLLSGAGVLVRSFVNIVGAETGVRDPGRILVGRVRMPSDRYPSPGQRREYLDRLEAQLSDVPGVEEEAVASTTPVRGTGVAPFEIDGQAGSQDGEPLVSYLPAGTAYFHLIGASTLSGRNFTEDDGAASMPVAIVNESFASKFWPGRDAVGKRLRAKSPGASPEWRVVVGVVSNIMQSDATRQNFKPLVYVPFRQEPLGRTAFFLLRTHGAAEQMARAVRTRVQEIDPDVSLENYGSLQASFAFDRDFMDLAHSELGKHAKVAPVFASIALVLAAIGLYAVLAHSIGQRTKEFAVRLAIGAVAADIWKLVLRDGMKPVAIGVVAGLVASLAVNRVLQSQLVGVSPYDPTTMGGALGGLLLIALLACQIPARRATNVAPAAALRHD